MLKLIVISCTSLVHQDVFQYSISCCVPSQGGHQRVALVPAYGRQKMFGSEYGRHLPGCTHVRSKGKCCRYMQLQFLLLFLSLRPLRHVYKTASIRRINMDDLRAGSTCPGAQRRYDVHSHNHRCVLRFRVEACSEALGVFKSGTAWTHYHR